MPDPSTQTETRLDSAAKALHGARGKAFAHNTPSPTRTDLVRLAHAEATLAVAEELRALREQLLGGGSVTVEYGGSVAP